MQASNQQYAQAWYEALKESKKSERAKITQNMLKKLQVEGKLSLLMSIVREIQRLADHDLGVQHVKVRSAQLIDEKELERLIAEMLGTDKVAVSQKKDESILGGVVVETADQRWDLSVMHQLNNLKRSLSQ